MKRTGLALTLAAAVFLHACCIINIVGGDFTHQPEQMAEKLSPESKALIAESLKGLSREAVTDHHIHIIGIDREKTGCYVNPDMKSWLHPALKVRYLTYMSSSKITDERDVDERYVARLVSLIRSSGILSRNYIMAFDKYYNADGTVDDGKTQFHTPNEYVASIAAKYPDIFIPIVSIHPYRKDAVAELEKWAAKGVRFVKWIPNAMGMDPSDEKCVPFYKAMIKKGMVLYCHTGKEDAFRATDQRLGNPLLLRKPLDMGLRVVVGHCASGGRSVDLDDPKKASVDSFDLFMRLMDEKKYEGLLFGEISAMTQYNRIGKPLRTVMKRTDLHHRLINGSDYPLPAVNFLIRTGKLAGEGFITEAERRCLNEIYGYNPLLFDFVLKRIMRLPGTSIKLSDCIYGENPGLR